MGRIMSIVPTQPSDGLPPSVSQVLANFTAAAQSAFGGDLCSIVLYGSAAEGRMRSTSDVNIIVVLSAFDSARADSLRDTLRTAQAAVRLAAMFLLQSEVAAAVELFAVKFADVFRRRRILVGIDPFVGLEPSRSAEIVRLKQVLLNLVLRLRQQYLLRSLREEQATVVLAETAGPLRACAAALLDLEGVTAVGSAKAALERFARSLPPTPSEPAWEDVVGRISDVRQQHSLAPGLAGPTLLRLIGLATAMRARVEALRP